MPTTRRPLLARSLALGVAGGMRSMTPLAAVVLTHPAAPPGHGWRDWPVLRHPWGRALVIAMAAAELVGDKLPATPSRLALPALLGRIGAAALAGAALGTEGPRGAAPRAAGLAAVGALLGAMAGYGIRRSLVDASRLPDPAVAVLEDAAALALSRAATSG